MSAWKSGESLYFADYALAFRDGSRGNIALMAKNDPSFYLDKFEYKVFRARRDSKIAEAETPLVLAQIEDSIHFLTQQGGQEWFLLRLFRCTSSTVLETLRITEAFYLPKNFLIR